MTDWQTPNKPTKSTGSHYCLDDLMVKFADPRTLTSFVVLGTPMLFTFFVSILFLSALFVYGSFLEPAFTNTPCFLNRHDLLLFQSMQLQADTFLFGMPVEILHKIGARGMVTHYLEFVMLTILLQIAASYWLVNKSQANLAKLKEMNHSQVALIVAFSLIFMFLASGIMKKNENVYQFQKMAQNEADRLTAYKLKISPAQVKDVNSVQLAKQFNIEPVVLDQCPFSNNIHLIPDNQKSYIGLN